MLTLLNLIVPTLLLLFLLHNSTSTSTLLNPFYTIQITIPPPPTTPASPSPSSTNNTTQSNSKSTLSIPPSEEPTDAIYAFAILHGLSEERRFEILREACEEIVCVRSEAVLFELPVDFGNYDDDDDDESENESESESETTITLKIYEGENPRLAISEFCDEHGIDEDGKGEIMGIAMASSALDFMRGLDYDDDDDDNDYYDDDDDDGSGDVIYSTMISINPTSNSNNSDSDSHSHSHSSAQQQQTHLLKINKHQEPADAIYAFLTLHSLSHDDYTSMLYEACEVLKCAREEPDLVRVPVEWGGVYVGLKVRFLLRNYSDSDGDGDGNDGNDDDSGGGEGNVKESVIRFCALHDVKEGDERCVALLEDVERQTTVYDRSSPPQKEKEAKRNTRKSKSTENGDHYDNEEEDTDTDTQLIYKTKIETSTGTYIGTLLIYLNEEPVDVIYHFCLLHSLPLEYREAILEGACEEVECYRVHPVVYRLPVSVSFRRSDSNNGGSDDDDDDDGKEDIKTLVIYEGEDPMSVINEFALRYKLTTAYKNLIINSAKKSPDLEWRKATAPASMQHQHQQQRRQKQRHVNDNDYDYENNNEGHSQTNTKALVIYTVEIERPNGTLIGSLSIHEDEEPVDAIYRFCLLHSLDTDYRDAILMDACEDVECSRVSPVIYSLTVDLGSDEGGKGKVELIVLEDEDPMFAIRKFCFTYDIGEAGHRTLVAELQKSSNVLTFKNEADRMVVFSSTGIMMANGTSLGKLKVYDDEEPADVVFAFLKAKHLNLNETEKDNMYAFLVNHICSLKLKTDSVAASASLCSRTMPLIWSSDVVDNAGDFVGTVSVLKNDEPIDAIHRFTTHYNLTKTFRDRIMRNACGGANPVLTCTRNRPVLYNQTYVVSETEAFALVVEEGDEPVDVLAFVHVTEKLSVDFETLKNVTLNVVCKIPGITCTRRVAVLYEEVLVLFFADKDDKDKNKNFTQTLTIMEKEEPVEAIWKFLEAAYPDQSERHQSERQAAFWRLQDVVCASQLIQCVQRSPLIYGPQNITGGGGGGTENETSTAVGYLTIMLDEEPVDAVYRFFARSGLFGKGWKLDEVAEQICKSVVPFVGYGCECRRKEAVKFFTKKLVVRMEDTGRFPEGLDVGRVLIMEDEEVVDAAYQLRLKHNLTVVEQMRTFADICKSPDVLCEKSKAVVYRREVNYLDYDVLKNEKDDQLFLTNATCKRKYAGWRYLGGNGNAMLNNTFIKTKVMPVLSKEEAGVWFEEDYFTVALFALFYALARITLFLFTKALKWNRYTHAALVKLQRTLTTHHNHNHNQPTRMIMTMIRRTTLLLTLTLTLTSFLLTSLTTFTLLEPTDQIDLALHLHVGKLPPLTIHEGTSLIDGVWAWADKTQRVHHPLLRSRLYWQLMEEVCRENEGSSVPGFQCYDENDNNSADGDGGGDGDGVEIEIGKEQRTRRRTRTAHERVHLGMVTLNRIDHNLTYWKDTSVPVVDGDVSYFTDQLKTFAVESCARIDPPWNNCVKTFTAHCTTELSRYEKSRGKQKNVYVKLGIASDASITRVYDALRIRYKLLGQNLSPYTRVDNGTASHHSWDVQIEEYHGIINKIEELLEKGKRDWYDKPCEPVFNGAMCAKKDKDGNMSIEMGGGES